MVSWMGMLVYCCRRLEERAGRGGETGMGRLNVGDMGSVSAE